MHCYQLPMNTSGPRPNDSHVSGVVSRTRSVTAPDPVSTWTPQERCRSSALIFWTMPQRWVIWSVARSNLLSGPFLITSCFSPQAEHRSRHCCGNGRSRIWESASPVLTLEAGELHSAAAVTTIRTIRVQRSGHQASESAGQHQQRPPETTQWSCWWMVPLHC